MCATRKLAAGRPAPLTIPERLHAFIAHYTGLVAVGDTPGNRGECVGLVEVWIDSLKLPHVWGNAADLLANADPIHYKRVNNQPTNYPAVGDIVVFGTTWGGGYGHTGICVTGHVMDLSLFQQNDPAGSSPHIKVYGYAGIIGWLHPRVTP